MHRDMLIDHYGYQSENIVMMTDNLSRRENNYPTKHNIMTQLRELVKKAELHGDDKVHLTITYSGHGIQVRDTNGDEKDKKDEALLPVDYEKGVITDDEFKRVVINPIANNSNVKLTLIMDCCHSGSICDLRVDYLCTDDKRYKRVRNLAVRGDPFNKPTRHVPFKTKKAKNKQFNYSKFYNTINGKQHRKLDSAYTVNPKYSQTKADIVMISGCMDKQTSADAFEAGRNIGAMSHALHVVLKAHKYKISHRNLVNNLRTWLKRKGYDQIPQISAGSEAFQANGQFSF